jgi:hypothetical protein
MRNVLLLLVLGATMASAAEVNVEIIFDQEQFLRSESLPLRVRISNFSGQTLKFGDMPEWLTFSVESREGTILRKTGEVPLPKSFTLDSSKTASLRADLMPYFKLNDVGHYSVTARLKIPQLEKELVTEPKTFDIVAGTKLWEREFGVPHTKPPVLRKYALQQATFLKQLRLYVRVTDPDESTVVSVLPIGTLVSFSQPEAVLDKSSHLHVLFQTGARTFIYAVVSPEGEQIIRQTWDYTNTRPRLHAEDDGRVLVRGGARRILLSDLPPPRVAQTNETVDPK